MVEFPLGDTYMDSFELKRKELAFARSKLLSCLLDRRLCFSHTIEVELNIWITLRESFYSSLILEIIIELKFFFVTFFAADVFYY